jgi:hypothetical protein
MVCSCLLRVGRAWYGWFIPRPLSSGGPEFWNKAEGSFFAVLETYNGVVLAVGGLITSVYFFRKHDWKWFWLSLAFIAGGSIFGYDGVWSLIRGR